LDLFEFLNEDGALVVEEAALIEDFELFNDKEIHKVNYFAVLSNVAIILVVWIQFVNLLCITLYIKCVSIE
jgi:hypothetical protein